MNVLFHRNFRKRYEKVPVKIRRKFDSRLRMSLANPFEPILNNHSLTGDKADEWSINITGDWRAIYIYKGKDIVVFSKIGTHSDLYE